jgi:molecular chaperone DnaK (HSP70)
MSKVAIDFGTTNTVVAVCREEICTPETLALPELSAPSPNSTVPPLIPSLVYVQNGVSGRVMVGQAVRAAGYDKQNDERLFTSFKRGIAAESRAILRKVDGMPWGDVEAGEAFLRTILAAIVQSEGEAPEEVILAVPIQSFENYLKWLRTEVVRALWPGRRLRIVDESTAAALGYDIRKPGELVLVFDFGGGTLDVSVVRMPSIGEHGSIVFDVDRSDITSTLGSDPAARVLAKAGRVLGGDDIDHWLIEEFITRNSLKRSQIGPIYVELKIAAEAAKIKLSSHETAEVSAFHPKHNRTYKATFSRTQLEDILDRHEFYTGAQRTVDKALRSARTRGILPEDIGAVLMIGGTSLIPSVGRIMRMFFGSERVFMHKPFEAVAHGALTLAAGTGLDDFLYHSYGIRHLSSIFRQHEYEEIIPAGTRYPLQEPIELILSATRDGQDAIELVIGEVEEDTTGVTEVVFGDRIILMVEEQTEVRRIIALNAEGDARTLASLIPPGRAGEDRVRVRFNVDDNRTLRVTVIDLLTDQVLLYDIPVVELR